MFEYGFQKLDWKCSEKMPGHSTAQTESYPQGEKYIILDSLALRLCNYGFNNLLRKIT